MRHYISPWPRLKPRRYCSRSGSSPSAVSLLLPTGTLPRRVAAWDQSPDLGMDQPASSQPMLPQNCALSWGPPSPHDSPSPTQIREDRSHKKEKIFKKNKKKREQPALLLLVFPPFSTCGAYFYDKLSCFQKEITALPPTQFLASLTWPSSHCHLPALRLPQEEVLGETGCPDWVKFVKALRSWCVGNMIGIRVSSEPEEMTLFLKFMTEVAKDSTFVIFCSVPYDKNFLSIYSVPG